MTARAPDRSPALDGLRGVAIGLVVIHHTTAFLWPSTFDHWLSGGFLGVDLFFVLSGYLITTLLLERRERGEQGLGKFYKRRILRLMPALLVMMAVVTTVEVVSAPGVGSAPFTIVATLANLGNWAFQYAPRHFMAPIGIVWSLAIEEQFYLVWPVTLWLLLRMGRSRRWILCAVLPTIGLVVAHRAQLWHANPVWSDIYARTDARLDGLLVGAALALAAPFVHLRRVPARLVSIVATATLVGFLSAAQLVRRDASALYLGGFTLVALGAAILVAAVIDGRWGGCRALAWRPLAALGRVSYGVYLWHYPVFMLVSQHTPTNVTERLLLGFGITAPAVMVSWFALERPALSWKSRIDARERKAPAHAIRAGVPTHR